MVLSLCEDLLDLTQGLVDRQFHLISQGCHLALNGVDWLDYDGALSADGPSHSTELSGMGITPAFKVNCLPSLAKVCCRLIPVSLATSTSFCRATSSKRLSGWNGIAIAQ